MGTGDEEAIQSSDSSWSFSLPFLQVGGLSHRPDQRINILVVLDQRIDMVRAFDYTRNDAPPEDVTEDEDVPPQPVYELAIKLVLYGKNKVRITSLIRSWTGKDFHIFPHGFTVKTTTGDLNFDVTAQKEPTFEEM
ncbi:hypothetical protein H6P81_002664 [Aristolochia fimbriata]|uniref:Uncharacterized protein n=1 Tax=Aristolochia fimbriata TaxID=158543 RepID=A0AAV7FDL2_ARIFI|nr:hypothetical protein H6P81_002664 [Aristolochia fimbriata]